MSFNYRTKKKEKEKRTREKENVNKKTKPKLREKIPKKLFHVNCLVVFTSKAVPVTSDVCKCSINLLYTQ